MRTIRKCEWCHRRLKGYGKAEVCPSCRRKLEGILDRHLELVNIALTVKQVAMQLNMSSGHVRRILEHPEKYPWRYYGITEAHKPGKEWRVFLTPLEHKKELEKQLMDIGQVALKLMRTNAMFGLGPVLTPSDMRDLLEGQITPLPRRKTPREREEQKKRLRENMDQYLDRFFAAIAPMVEEKLSEMELLRSIASTGQQHHTLGVGHERQRQSNLSNAGS